MIFYSIWKDIHCKGITQLKNYIPFVKFIIPLYKTLSYNVQEINNVTISGSHVFTTTYNDNNNASVLMITDIQALEHFKNITISFSTMFQNLPNQHITQKINPTVNETRVFDANNIKELRHISDSISQSFILRSQTRIQKNDGYNEGKIIAPFANLTTDSLTGINPTNMISLEEKTNLVNLYYNFVLDFDFSQSTDNYFISPDNMILARTVVSPKTVPNYATIVIKVYPEAEVFFVYNFTKTSVGMMNNNVISEPKVVPVFSSMRSDEINNAQVFDKNNTSVDIDNRTTLPTTRPIVSTNHPYDQTEYASVLSDSMDEKRNSSIVRVTLLDNLITISYFCKNPSKQEESITNLPTRTFIVDISEYQIILKNIFDINDNNNVEDIPFNIEYKIGLMLFSSRLFTGNMMKCISITDLSDIQKITPTFDLISRLSNNIFTELESSNNISSSNKGIVGFNNLNPSNISKLFLTDNNLDWNVKIIKKLPHSRLFNNFNYNHALMIEVLCKSNKKRHMLSSNILASTFASDNNNLTLPATMVSSFDNNISNNNVTCTDLDRTKFAQTNVTPYFLEESSYSSLNEWVGDKKYFRNRLISDNGDGRYDFWYNLLRGRDKRDNSSQIEIDPYQSCLPNISIKALFKFNNINKNNSDDWTIKLRNVIYGTGVGLILGTTINKMTRNIKSIVTTTSVEQIFSIASDDIVKFVDGYMFEFSHRISTPNRRLNEDIMLFQSTSSSESRTVNTIKISSLRSGRAYVDTKRVPSISMPVHNSLTEQVSNIDYKHNGVMKKVGNDLILYMTRDIQNTVGSRGDTIITNYLT